MIDWIKKLFRQNIHIRAWVVVLGLAIVPYTVHAIAVSALTALTGANTATGDLFVVVDISEPVAADRTKNITRDELAVGLALATSNLVVVAEIDTESELETVSNITNILRETEIDASSELLAIMDDETGTGALVFGTSPTFTTGIAVPADSISDSELDEGAAFVWTGLQTFDALIDVGAVETFTDTDATPDVSTGVFWDTFTNTLTITDFDGTPLDGQLLYIESKAAITYDCTASGLDCGSTNIVTASGDFTSWIFTGTNWQLLAFKDQSTDMGTDATGGGSITDNGDAEALVISSDEEITLPKQPCFLAFNSVTDLNKTGAGTATTIDFDTEVYDQGGDFAADTFTAPITGKYQLSVAVNVNDITTNSADIGLIEIVTSNRVYRGSRVDRTNDFSAIVGFSIGAIVDMDAADTATVRVQIFGMAGNTVDIEGNATILMTFFSGCLLA